MSCAVASYSTVRPLLIGSEVPLYVIAIRLYTWLRFSVLIAIRLYTWLRFTVCDSDEAVHLAEVHCM